MQFNSIKINAVNASLKKFVSASMTTRRGFTITTTATAPTKLAVVCSLSNCPYENLAYEDYIYETEKFDENYRMLYIWRNDKTVVIGRHQNPWKEVDLKEVRKKHIKLCRRKSGGGTVYHDLGNVNLTFFSHKSNYNRKENLDFIVNFLGVGYELNTCRNHKDDIIFNRSFKVSGTAAKLGLNNAYHHCTLLCNTNLKLLDGLLTKSFGTIETNATGSVPSPTSNLFSNSFNFEDFCEKLSYFYLEYFKLNRHYNLNDNPTIPTIRKFGKTFQPVKTGIRCHGNSSIIRFINPIDIPDVSKNVTQLSSWDWVYGKSPAFVYSNVLQVNGVLSDISFAVSKGKIDDIIVTNDRAGYLFKTLKSLINSKFHRVDMKRILESNVDRDSSIINQIYEWF